MKKIFAILLCLCMVFAAVACTPATGDGQGSTPAETPAASTPSTPDNTDPTAAEYKLGMGIVVDTSSSADGKPQVDATVATVVLDKDGKIVVCRIDAVQNKATIADGVVTATNLKTKMELGDEYGMAAAVNYGMDWNGDGVVKEWYDQVKAFEAYVVGKTAAEVEAMATKEVEGKGYIISADDALLTAGCTIQITDFKAAVVKACNDDQATTFTTAAAFTLGVSANSSDSSVAATEDTAGTVQMYSDFAATVVADGKIVAALNDAIQPKIAFEFDGTIGETNFKGTKRELKEGYNMAAYGSDNDGDGRVLEWYVQSAEFSKYVVGKTAAEIAALETEEVNAHFVSTDDALISAGCTMQITGIMVVVAQAANNAR